MVMQIEHVDDDQHEEPEVRMVDTAGESAGSEVVSRLSPSRGGRAALIRRRNSP